uniref:4-coumarate--CoA ligase n=1 Tax=Chenopodium quinoa TaxID=63459 RepID=A0A803LTR9_CHEQI
MNPLSSFSEAKKQTLSSHAKLAFTLPGNAEKLSSLGLKIIQVPTNILIREETQNFPEFSNLIFGKNHEKTPFLPPKINQDDTAAILYSSGTSGASKGVMLTHRNLIATVELFVRFEASQYNENMDHEKNVYLAVMPMFHIYGLALFGVGLISLGTNIVVMTHFPLVPPILGALTAKAKSLGGVFGVSQLCSLKQVSCGAAPLTTKILADFLHTFPTVDFYSGNVADDKAGEIPVAFVVKKPGSLLSRNDIVKYVPDMVAPHKKVREVVFVKSIPKSVAGKVLRRNLKNLLPSNSSKL